MFSMRDTTTLPAVYDVGLMEKLAVAVGEMVCETVPEPERKGDAVAVNVAWFVRVPEVVKVSEGDALSDLMAEVVATGDADAEYDAVGVKVMMGALQSARGTMDTPRFA